MSYSQRRLLPANVGHAPALEQLRHETEQNSFFGDAIAKTKTAPKNRKPASQKRSNLRQSPPLYLDPINRSGSFSTSGVGQNNDASKPMNPGFATHCAPQYLSPARPSSGVIVAPHSDWMNEQHASFGSQYGTMGSPHFSHPSTANQRPVDNQGLVAIPFANHPSSYDMYLNVSLASSFPMPSAAPRSFPYYPPQSAQTLQDHGNFANAYTPALSPNSNMFAQGAPANTAFDREVYNPHTFMPQQSAVVPMTMQAAGSKSDPEDLALSPSDTADHSAAMSRPSIKSNGRKRKRDEQINDTAEQSNSSKKIKSSAINTAEIYKLIIPVANAAFNSAGRNQIINSNLPNKNRMLNSHTVLMTYLNKKHISEKTFQEYPDEVKIKTASKAAGDFSFETAPYFIKSRNLQMHEMLLLGYNVPRSGKRLHRRKPPSTAQ